MTIVLVGGRGWDCNSFLLKDPKANAFDMVDAGNGVDFQSMLAEVAAVINPKRVRTVAITHEHLDHVNGLPAWQQLGAKIATSPACAQKLRVGHDPTSEMFGSSIPTLDVDVELEDAGRIQLGDASYETLLTPGHSPGSMCFWEPSEAVLFAGDTLFAEGGIGRFDFPDGDLALLHESILRLEKLPTRVLHSGHGPSSVGDEAARSIKGSAAHVTQCVHEGR